MNFFLHWWASRYHRRSRLQIGCLASYFNPETNFTVAVCKSSRFNSERQVCRGIGSQQPKKGLYLCFLPDRHNSVICCREFCYVVFLWMIYSVVAFYRGISIFVARIDTIQFRVAAQKLTFLAAVGEYYQRNFFFYMISLALSLFIGCCPTSFCQLCILHSGMTDSYFSS